VHVDSRRHCLIIATTRTEGSMAKKATKSKTKSASKKSSSKKTAKKGSKKR
jgi:hypothetical protein